MKKFIGILLFCALLVATSLMLVSCGELSGTYKGNLCSLTFKGDNVTISLGNAEITGEYDIETEDGKKTISFDFIDLDEATEEQAHVLSVVEALISGKLSFKEDRDKIQIGWFVFTKD